ncbi:MAG: PTS sugar transporter subunit IIA [Planctomycetota bacterium]|nr:PTS sugar transporter subunit IIA [Planctomycetota bacterium]
MDGDRITLDKHLDASRVIQLTATTKDEALVELVDSVAETSDVHDRDALLEAVRNREKLLSTGIGLGIAIPHARIESVHGFVVAVGRRPDGIEFGSIDGKPVTIVVLIAGPKDAQKPYLELLAQLSKRLKLEEVRRHVAGDATPEEVVALLTET